MKSDLRIELIHQLQNAEKPLTLSELSLRIGRPFPAVFAALVAARSAGAVDRLEGGFYGLRLAPALLELFAAVHACEVEWRLDDRLGLFASSKGSRS